MITIFSKKAIRFRNPDPAALIVTPPPPENPNFSAQDNANLAAKVVAADASRLGKRSSEPPFVDTKPGEIQQVPDWVKTDPMWHWALADGDLMEIKEQPQAKSKPAKPAKPAKPSISDEAQIAQNAQQSGDSDSEKEQKAAADLQKTAPPGATRKQVTKGQ